MSVSGVRLTAIPTLRRPLAPVMSLRAWLLEGLVRTQSATRPVSPARAAYCTVGRVRPLMFDQISLRAEGGPGSSPLTRLLFDHLGPKRSAQRSLFTKSNGNGCERLTADRPAQPVSQVDHAHHAGQRDTKKHVACLDRQPDPLCSLYQRSWTTTTVLSRPQRKGTDSRGERELADGRVSGRYVPDEANRQGRAAVRTEGVKYRRDGQASAFGTIEGSGQARAARDQRRTNANRTP